MTKQPKTITYKSLAQIAFGIFIGIFAANNLQLKSESEFFNDILNNPIDSKEQAFLNN